ncbi:ABC transporter substrate-binding protein [Aeromicrobium sp. YIM 150415]|uniref:ABC transporter substrate-binding protein n=1 Tax=Aeromicrobium sp. YIM 150415 TaxID=2803912 RepID=UPI001962941C|nr:ABC transporter substrate-binding protein [Aeromicrobium sp. YIM 150415]MBM9464455.1 ABC transporter substrate-binding protein [Aeromicrobium sp. YIM 150415]
MNRSARHAAIGAVVLVTGLGLSACGSDASETSGSSGSGDGSYPMTLSSPFGETTLEEKPETVAVVSDVDLDIAVALGVDPVIAPLYGEISPWTADAAEEQGFEIETFDPSDGVDFAAIAETEPDVILATSGYTLEDDYEKLAKIAPVVSYQGDDGLSAMSWQDRTNEVAEALDLTDEAERIEADIDAAFAEVRETNPDFEGTTYTQINIHPEQITYESWEGSDASFFTDLGFVQAPNAGDFDASNNAVSKENLDQIDADVLFVGYPFGDEGVLTQDELESDRLFTSLTSVSGGHYAVIPDEVASPLTYKTPLSVPWVLEELTPLLQQAVAGS